MLRILIVMAVWLSLTNQVIAEVWKEPEVQDVTWVEPNQADIDSVTVSVKKNENLPADKTDLFNSEMGKANKFFSDYNYKQSMSTLGEKKLPSQFMDEHYKKLMTNSDSDKPRQLSSNIFVFATFSMSDDDLIKLGKDLSKINGHLVFNGFLVDAKTTIKKVSDLINTSGVTIPVMIDPTMFERFNINSAPVYVIPKNGVSPCINNDDCPIPENISARGLMPVSYFLEKVISSGDLDYKGRVSEWLKII